jgi:hypothetical protein
MKKIIIFFTAALLIQGCVSTPENTPIKKDQLEVKTYTYTDLDGTKELLWKRANNYLASTYNNSKAILRVSDIEQGTLIGKGSYRWKMLDSYGSPYCLSEYQIRFIAKDQKARLQLELLEGAPPLSKCIAWTLPSGYGYSQIMNEFDDISEGLENALRGSGKLESMSDF